MLTKIKVEKEVDIRFLQVNAGVRYWKNAKVNGIDDEEGELIPFKDGDYWRPKINVDTGFIIGWPAGTTAEIHYKVCDDGEYKLLDENGEVLIERHGYVPDTLCPEESGYGDYIIMKVQDNGYISNWKFDVTDFTFTPNEH